MRRSRALSLSARLAVSGVILAVLVVRTPSFDLGSLVPRWTWEASLSLALGGLLTLAAVFLSAVRWRNVLQALDVEAPVPRLFSHCLAGQFISNVLPTTIGGDVLRVARLSRDTGQSPAAFASVVLERLTGWLVLPVITVVGFALNPGLLRLGAATAVALALAGSTLVALVGLSAAVASRRLGGRVASHAGWRRFAGAVHLGLNQLRSHPAAGAQFLLAGFAYQLTLVAAAVAAARALGIEAAGPTAMLAFFPAVLIAQVLPISLAGLGIREGAFVLFLGPLGVASAEAVALGLLLYLLNVVVGLLGAPAFAAHAPRGTPLTPGDRGEPGSVAASRVAARDS